MDALRQERLFVALTRPQMFAGVTYGFFVINAILTAELFLIFRSFWVFPLAILVHLVGMMLCLREPRAVDLYLTCSMTCPRVRNYRLWLCNSYRA